MKHLLLLIVTSYLLYGTAFDIEVFKAGPNPLVQQKDGLIINYTASIPHQSDYYIYNVTGQRLKRISFENSSHCNTTNAGECNFELLSTIEMQQLHKQLIVIIAVFKANNQTIKKKRYVIIK